MCGPRPRRRTAHGHAGAARVHGAGAVCERGPRPRGRSPTRPRPAQRARPSSAVQRSARRARRRRCCMVASRWRLTGARETAGENVAQLTEAWTTAWHDGVDSGVGWHGERGRRRHGGSATTDSELRGRVRGLARSEVRDTGGATHSPAWPV
jgi:hypothetical protein